MKKFHSKITLLLTFALCIPLFSSCGQKQTFEEYTNKLFLDEISANTLNLHYTIENPDAYGIKNYDISLGGYSSDDNTSYVNGLKKLKLELLTYPYTTLTLEEQLTYDIMNDFLDTQLAMSGFTLYDEPLSYSNGMQMQLPILLAEYEFNSEQDVKDYLELITLVDEYLDDMIQFEKDKAKAGLFMSDELCNRVIDSCKAFLENQENHYMLSTFENRLKDLNLSDSKTQKHIASNTKTFKEEIVPAYEELIEELTALLGSGKNQRNICSQ